MIFFLISYQWPLWIIWTSVIFYLFLNTQFSIPFFAKIIYQLWTSVFLFLILINAIKSHNLKFKAICSYLSSIIQMILQIWSVDFIFSSIHDSMEKIFTADFWVHSIMYNFWNMKGNKNVRIKIILTSKKFLYSGLLHCLLQPHVTRKNYLSMY